MWNKINYIIVLAQFVFCLTKSKKKMKHKRIFKKHWPFVKITDFYYAYTYWGDDRVTTVADKMISYGSIQLEDWILQNIGRERVRGQTKHMYSYSQFTTGVSIQVFSSLCCIFYVIIVNYSTLSEVTWGWGEVMKGKTREWQ